MSAPSTSSLSVKLLSQVIEKVSLIARCSMETETYEGVIFKVECVTSMGN